MYISAGPSRSGGTATGPAASPARGPTVPAAHESGADPGPPLERRVSPASSDRPDSARSSACRPRPCTACSCVTAAAVSPIWIGPRAGRPPDPYRPCQRARSPRREVARQDPAGRGLTGAREGPLSPLPGRLRRHPLGDRRLLPAPLLRDPRRRAGGHRDRMRRSMRETRSCCSSARSLPTTR
jgi:hypothetical protein